MNLPGSLFKELVKGSIKLKAEHFKKKILEDGRTIFPKISRGRMITLRRKALLEGINPTSLGLPATPLREPTVFTRSGPSAMHVRRVKK